MDISDKPPSSLFAKLTTIFQKAFPNNKGNSKSELLDTLKEAEIAGTLNRDSYDMMHRVMQVSDLQVRDVMIPRSKMVTVDKENTLEECLGILIESAHSRFPVLDNEKDSTIGILLAKDILKFFDAESRKHFNLRDLLRPCVFVPESKRLNVLLSDFRQNRNHMAIVVDEFGNVAGLVTIEDVLEQIVGEIDDEHDFNEDEGLIRTLYDGDCIIKAILSIEEFNEHFSAKLEDDNCDTMGGIVSQKIGHVPERGESVEIDGFKFEIVHSDSRRIHLIRITRINKNE